VQEGGQPLPSTAARSSRSREAHDQSALKFQTTMLATIFGDAGEMPARRL